MYFATGFDGVHAFGYNSAESEPIWMKSGALWVDYRGLALVDFGRDRALATAGEPGEIFWQVCKTRFHRCPFGQISRDLNTVKHGYSDPVEIWTHVDRCRDEMFQNRTLKILPLGVVFLRKRNNFSNIFNDLRLQAAITDYRSPKIRYQNNPLWDV